MVILTQFLLRLSFGLAVGMAITSPQLVSSGFFRNHLYVTLGLATLAAVASRAAAPATFWYAVGAALASYAGSVCWLYEKKVGGAIALIFVAMLSLQGTLALPNPFVANDEAADRYLSAIPGDLTTDELSEKYITIAGRLWGPWSGLLAPVSNVTSGLLLGTTFAAMLLGHWYLNAPGMELAPLRRLISAAAGAVAAQALVSGAGLTMELSLEPDVTLAWLLFVLLRWSFGLFGLAGLLWMSYQTLKIPNTQSATGILYVAVIGAFVGELAAVLLSAESAFPL
jgi:hypothetical protein